MSDAYERGLLAFRRLLAEAAEGGQAKVDAVVALSQRTVFVATWATGDDGFRTLTSSNGETALPVFTDEEQLRTAAGRFGWQMPDGSVPFQEVGARKAFRHATAHGLPFVVVDIASEHALEIAREEVEPLLSPSARRDSAGPFAAVGKISESMLRAARATPSQGTPKAIRPAEPSATTPESERRPSSHPPPRMKSEPAQATFGSGSSVTILSTREPPPDALLEALTAGLRGYPEVEWAAFCLATRGPAEAKPTVGIRVDTSFRQRLNDIISDLRRIGDEHGASLDVLLLDDPDLMRVARTEALPFYPWRRR